MGAGTLSLGATAEDRFGNVGVATPIDINVIADPLTVVTGNVLDSAGNMLENADVTCFGLTAPSTAVGSFSVSGVPTNQGPVTCAATFVTANGRSLMGISNAAEPVPGGTTDGGNIIVRDAPLFPVAKHRVGSQPLAVATGDLNNDGLIDIATANEADSSVSILLATGKGQFEPELVPTAPSVNHPFGLRIIDIDKDGNLDLLVLNGFFHPATLLVGDGGGGFVESVLIEAFGISDAAVVDVDGDSVLDILAVGSGFLMVLEGENGFGTPVFHTIEAGSIQGFGVADFDGNDVPDVVIARGSSSEISLLLNDGAGGFPIETSVGSGSGFTALTPTDFNLDDNPDFAAVNPGDGTWTAFFGAGDGSFVGTEQEIRAFTLGPREFAIATAEFNGDTLPDVVVVGTSGDEASVYLNQGDGTFDLSQVLAVPPLPGQLAAADVTGDGNADIVVSMTLGVTGNVGEDDEVAVVIGRGDGTFVTRTDLSLDPSPPTDVSGDGAESAEYADVDNDGFGDIVTTNGSQVGIFFGTADGSFEAQPMKISIEGQEPRRSVVADMNDEDVRIS